MAKLGLVVLGIVVAVQVSCAYYLAVPVFKQPYGDGDVTRIIDGQTAQKGQFPYQAGITLDNVAFCGGALISRSWVLTAGHCVNGVKKWVVVLGAQKINDPSEPGHEGFVSKKAILHERYNQGTISNDIGLISLPKNVELTDRINTIPLPPRSFKNENFVGKTVQVSGWGKTSDEFNGGMNPELAFVDLIIADLEVCKKIYGDIVKDTHFCCTGEGQKNTCKGDSGGALTIGSGENRTHLGIVSFGVTLGCSKGYPSGYTATPAYVDWISNKTGIPVQDF